MSRSTIIHNVNCNKLNNMHQFFYQSLCVLGVRIKEKKFLSIFLMASAVGVSLNPSNEVTASSNEIL